MPSSSRRPRPPGPSVADLGPALAAAGWSLHREPGAVGGVVARDAAGTVCEVALLAAPADPGARAALVEHLRGLGGEHDHLAAVRGVVAGDGSSLAVLVDHVGGLRLDELAAAREPLRAGEAVTVLVPVAQALTALHREGRSHGALDATSVVVAPDGRTVLRPPLAPTTASSADDVRDLARTVLGLVPPPASSHPAHAAPPDPDEARALAALHAELAVALRDEPAARPAVGTFAARCYDAVEPQPIVMPDPARLVAGALVGQRATRPAVPGRRAAREDVAAAPGRRGVRRPRGVPERSARLSGLARGTTAGAHARRPDRRRLRWPGRTTTALFMCAGLVAVVVALALGSPWPSPVRDDGPATTRTAPAADPATEPTLDRADPLGAARTLTARRLELLADGAGDLSAVVVAGSAAEARDAELLAALDGVDVVGARAEVFDARHVEPRPPDADEGHGAEAATVAVDYAVSAHHQRTAAGEVEVPATPRTTVVLVLRWTDAGWRVAEAR
ncbi:hypothetical protein [Cellulosimicrobium sp. TH-20]|uniref:hypothetical protein n=1 Tax=Cellulosimicrobium sp. TH-20 TaxID=1980001 RepID=UPI0011A5B423|nr:hypothetical protein [Cellulosimicrobium sp. TH-20]